MFYVLTGLLNAISSSVLGFFVFLKNPKRIVNKTFGIFCFFLAFWSYSYFFWQISTTEETALLWSRLLMAGAIFIPISYLHFVFVFTQVVKKSTVKIILFSGYLISLLFFVSNFTSLFVADVKPRLGFKFWPSAGILYTPFLIIWFLCAFYSIALLFKDYRNSIGIKKSQLSYILFGTIVGYLGGATNYFLWYGIPITPIGNWTITLYAFLVAYAIVRYRLMDIRFAFGRTAVYVFSFGTIIALAFLLMFLSNLLTQPLSLNVSGPLIIVSLILLFRPIFRFFEKIASKYFYYTFYSYQQVLADLGKRLTQFLDLGKLSSLITNTLINTMKLDRTVVLLREPETGNYQIQKNIGFREENGISLVKDNFLTIWLERSKKPLVYEELSLIIRDTQDREEKEKLEKLKEDMKRIEANLCLPLFIEEKIIGMIILGNKISREPYSQQDIELLTALSSQSSIALYNARLYDQVQDLSQNLQKKVDEQTREIKKAYEVEKQAHEELKKLDVAKTQFIRAATHHLRTPLTSIRGYLELILGGSYGKLNNTEIQKKILAVRKSANILQGLIEDILDITLLRTGKAILNLEEIQPEKIIEDIVKEEKLQAKTKGIYLKYQEPKTPLPKIMLDKKRIKEAIYNIVDNAVKYTEKGGITINLKSQILNLKNQRANIRIIVQDTGVGLSEEEQKMFLQGEYFFERGKEAEKLWGPGRGIGLVIAHEFIKAHQGKLWVESAGRGKGSTFYVELPAK